MVHRTGGALDSAGQALGVVLGVGRREDEGIQTTCFSVKK